MPCTTVRVCHAISRLGQRLVDRAASLYSHRPIHRRPDQRMPERHMVADRQQPVCIRANHRDRNPQSLGYPQQRQWIADWLRRRDQQQAPRVVRERLESADKAPLNPSCQRLRVQQP
jgi:hypothetical protein